MGFMDFFIDSQKIWWEIIIFFTYIVICGVLTKPRFSKKICLMISGATLALIFAVQIWMFFSFGDIMKIFTLLPLTAYLPSILCLHIISKSGFFQTITAWTTGLIAYRILKIFLKVLILIFDMSGKKEIEAILIVGSLSLLSALLLFLVIRFLRKPFQMYGEGSYGNWMFLCFPVFVVFLLFSYLGNMSWNISLQILIFFNMFVIFLLLIRALTAFASVEHMRESERTLTAYMQMQRKDYEEMCVKMETGRIYRHDMRHHLIVLKNLAKEKDTEHIMEYIGELCGQLSHTEHKNYCQNPTVNAVLSAYIEEAEKYCTVETRINIPKELPYDELDICAVLANALENAKNECRKTEGKEKSYIHISADLKGGTKLFLSVQNSCSEPVRFGEDNLPIAPTTGKHGIGLKSIQAVVKKYSGMLQCECRDRIFCLNAVLFCPHKEMPKQEAKILTKKRLFSGTPIPVTITVALLFLLLIGTIPLMAGTFANEETTVRENKICLIDWGELLFCANVPAIQLEKTYKETFEKNMDQIIDEMKREFLLYASQKYMGYVGGDITYKIMQDNDRFLSVRFDTTINLGGSMQYCRCLTMDKRNGKIISLDDLFANGYIEAISAEILRQMEEQVADRRANYYLPGGIWREEDCFKEITADRNFYINAENKLVIVFDEYEVAPGSMGMPEFVIPEEVLEKFGSLQN